MCFVLDVPVLSERSCSLVSPWPRIPASDAASPSISARVSQLRVEGFRFMDEGLGFRVWIEG